MPSREIPPTPAPRESGALALPWHAAPFAVLAACAGWLAVRWDALPARVPTHFGADGRPDAWGPRTVATVFGPVFVAAVVCAVLAGARALAAGVTEAAPDATDASRRRTRWIIDRTIVGAQLVLAVVLSAVAYGAVTGERWPFTFALVLPLVVLPVGVFAAVRRAGREADGPARGLFHVDREDPALFVPNRSGIGLTLNFGRWEAWLVVALLLAAPLVLVLAVSLLRG